MDPILKKHFDAGPPEMTARQLEDLCASMAMSFLYTYERPVLLTRDEHKYGYPTDASLNS